MLQNHSGSATEQTALCQANCRSLTWFAEAQWLALSQTKLLKYLGKWVSWWGFNCLVIVHCMIPCSTQTCEMAKRSMVSSSETMWNLSRALGLLVNKLFAVLSCLIYEDGTFRHTLALCWYRHSFLCNSLHSTGGAIFARDFSALTRGLQARHVDHVNGLTFQGRCAFDFWTSLNIRQYSEPNQTLSFPRASNWRVRHPKQPLVSIQWFKRLFVQSKFRLMWKYLCVGSGSTSATKLQESEVPASTPPLALCTIVT